MVMFFREIAIAPYMIGVRKGALLKIIFEEGFIGYADCHPWPELGDDTLKRQLELLQEGTPSNLGKRSLYFARLDALARHANVHLFRHLSIPPSHQLIPLDSIDDLGLLMKETAKGIYKLKAKIGQDIFGAKEKLAAAAPLLKQLNLSLRLDFNAKCTEQQFLDFLHESNVWSDCIEFYEDPFPFDPASWEAIRLKYGIKLACDRESLRALDYPDSCDFLVIKPAIQDPAPFFSCQKGSRKLIITSYLDHPLGQLAAAFCAAKAARQPEALLTECGLLSHHIYEENYFSKRFGQQGARLLPSLDGCGWGYDDLLEEQEWLYQKRLKIWQMNSHESSRG